MAMSNCPGLIFSRFKASMTSTRVSYTLTSHFRAFLRVEFSHLCDDHVRDVNVQNISEAILVHMFAHFYITRELLEFPQPTIIVLISSFGLLNFSFRTSFVQTVSLPSWERRAHSIQHTNRKKCLFS